MGGEGKTFSARGVVFTTFTSVVEIGVATSSSMCSSFYFNKSKLNRSKKTIKFTETLSFSNLKKEEK